ncbi:MAG: tRNA lysidine(34) synthetase TilS [Planctomycetia bacterium]|nr:tRNA lysidine(34) synthetase TilS [Planctomycetia bacterium]
MTRLLREVRGFMANREGGGVVAVSGGADSVALLRALEASGKQITIAHLNHKLRGAESDEDERFVRDLASELGVACRVATVDVAALGGNLESTARRVRYEFFAEIASDEKASWIATAHTADDQAETVLHRLVRGTGLQGLRGIASVRGQRSEDRDQKRPDDLSSDLCPLSSVVLMRPLLAVTRADVLEYLATLNQPYRTDSTNTDTRFTRNRIRHELLPLLKSFNPDVVSALAHLAEHANEAHEVLVALASELLAKAERPRAANAIILDAATLLAAPRAVLRAALRLVWEREGWPVSDMGFDAWDRAVEVAVGNAVACDFPDGVSMRHAGKVVQITRKE